eukprot:GHVS01022212.1.p1 GENE.GHVS01022212.1~~GHVS01022212.1.p1  ORF type:complete len:389 (+),score=97.18 GHVS01022212.1:179-1345(+)
MLLARHHPHEGFPSSRTPSSPTLVLSGERHGGSPTSSLGSPPPSSHGTSKKDLSSTASRQLRSPPPSTAGPHQVPPPTGAGRRAPPLEAGATTRAPPPPVEARRHQHREAWPAAGGGTDHPGTEEQQVGYREKEWESGEDDHWNKQIPPFYEEQIPSHEGTTALAAADVTARALLLQPAAAAASLSSLSSLRQLTGGEQAESLSPMSPADTNGSYSPAESNGASGNFDRSSETTLDLLEELSGLLCTGLDRRSLQLCVHLCELGIHPNVLAKAVSMVRDQTKILKELDRVNAQLHAVSCAGDTTRSGAKQREPGSRLSSGVRRAAAETASGGVASNYRLTTSKLLGGGLSDRRLTKDLYRPSPTTTTTTMAGDRSAADDLRAPLPPPP